MSSLYLAFDLKKEDIDKLSLKQTMLKQNSTGDFSDPSGFHITCSFIGETEKDNELVIEAMKNFRDELQFDKTNGPINLEAKNFYQFNKNVCWIGVNNSFPLYKIKKGIEKHMRLVGYQAKKDKFNGFTPHITMGYNVFINEDFNKTFNEIPITVEKLSLWHSLKCNGVHIKNSLFEIEL